MVKQMTEGSPLRLILNFSLPLLAGNLCQQTYNMVDAAIVGRTLGADALGAVGASTSVQFLVLGFCIGFCTGFAVPVAQRFGARHYHHMRRFIYLGGVLSVLIAAVLTLVCSILTRPILNLLQTPEDLMADAYGYLLIIFLGIPFTILYNFLSGVLRAVGDSRTPFLFLAFSSVLNIGLDLFCILVLRLGCAGAALATVASQAISGILCLILIWKKFEILRLRKEDRQWNGHDAGTLMVTGFPMGLQFSITAIGSMAEQSANNSLGTVYVTAFTAAMKIKQLMICPFDALASGVATFAGQNYGAGRVDRMEEGVKKGTFAGMIYGAAAGIALIFFGRIFSMLFVASNYTEVLNASAVYLRTIGFFYWLLGILNVIRLTVQAINYSGRAIFSGVVEMVARCLVAFLLVPKIGYAAVCISDPAAWISAVAYIVPTYLHCRTLVRKQITSGQRME